MSEYINAYVSIYMSIYMSLYITYTMCVYFFILLCISRVDPLPLNPATGAVSCAYMDTYVCIYQVRG